MKKIILIHLLISTIGHVFGQNRKFTFNESPIPSFNIDKINEANSLKDICPELWNKMGLSRKLILKLDSLKKAEFPLGYYANTPMSYDMLIDYNSVEISDTLNGKNIIANSNSEILSPAQKKLLSNAALGSTLRIVVKFKLKNRYAVSNNENIYEGFLYLKILPSIEAEFPGGMDQFVNYINTNIYDKCTSNKEYAQLSFMKIKFTVDKNGSITGTKILEGYKNEQLNRRVLDALNKMPKWKAAMNSKRMNVPQSFEFYFGSNGC